MADSSGAPAPAEATRAAPTSATPVRRWRLAGVVAGGVAVSAAVHIALVGTVLILGARGREPDPVKAVPVDVVTEDQLAALEKPDPQPPQPPAQPQLQIPDISSQPQQAAQPPQAPSPQTQSGAASAPAPTPPPPPPAPPNLDAFGPPVAPSAVPATSAPPPPAPPAPTTGQAAQLAQMLGLPKPVAVSGGAPSDYKADLTADAVAGFTAHVQSCWTPPPAAIKDANITVFIRVRLKRDGSLAGPPEPLGGSASMQALTLLQSSLNALKSCSAYTALPADKYDEWRVLDLRFTPNGISTAAPVRGAARPG
jgi:outer membrane biosynthesis protein TonB